MKVCICGGGALGHTCAAVAASKKDVTVNLLTGHPEAWENIVEATDPSGKVWRGSMNIVSDDPAKAVEGNDLILLCLPGFMLNRLFL